MISLPKILALAVIQGMTELLPVSSSAHVIVAEKFLGLNPTAPDMTLLLVMLHTGTMLSVIVFFWDSWKSTFFKTPQILSASLKWIGTATLATLIVGLVLKVLIEKIVFKGASHAEVEMLFGNLPLIACALAAAGLLIIWAGLNQVRGASLGPKTSVLIGIVQGLCLPFRGFSRSGGTISTGLLLGLDRKTCEDFSFALAVVLTPVAIVLEILRFLKSHHGAGLHTAALLLPSFAGMAFSFIAGLLALKWLSNWLEAGRWHIFGIYCLCAAAIIFFLHSQGL